MTVYGVTSRVRGAAKTPGLRWASTTRVRGSASPSARAATTRVRGAAKAPMLVSGGSAQTVEGGLVVTLDPELLFGDPPETWSWTLRSSSNPAVTAADMQFTELDVNGTWQYTSPGVDVTTTLTLEVTGHRAGFPDAVATRVDTVLIWPGPWVWRTVGGALKFVAQFPG